jgi:DNA transposition AAA+ family ATPase
MESKPDININQRISIPGDQVQQALTRLVEQGELDDVARGDIWWLFSYAMDNGWNLDDVGKAIDKDATTAYRLFLGRYGARYDNLVDAVARYRKLAVARGQRKSLGFVETTTWAKIDKVCRHALVGQLPAFIFGSSQIGKTTCLMEYARRNNHGQTRYIRMPASPGLHDALGAVARACYVTSRLSGRDLRERIIGAVNDRMLLLVDEMHQPLISGRGQTAVHIIEWLRELYDRTSCGIVFCGTRVFRDELERGKFALIMDQFRRRGIIQLVLPDVAPAADVVKIAKAFGLAAPEGVAAEIVRDMLKRSGLGQYVKFLQSASNLAANQKMPMSWDHFVTAYDLVHKLSTGKED